MTAGVFDLTVVVARPASRPRQPDGGLQEWMRVRRLW